MFKFLVGAWQMILFVWKYVRPIYGELMRIIRKARDLGLENEAARKKVFQDATDFIQARGLEKVPDSVLNCCIELTYQVYIWQNKKEAV